LLIGIFVIFIRPVIFGWTRAPFVDRPAPATPIIQFRVSGIRHQLPSIEYPATSIQHRASSIQHQVSSNQRKV